MGDDIHRNFIPPVKVYPHKKTSCGALEKRGGIAQDLPGP